MDIYRWWLSTDRMQVYAYYFRTDDSSCQFLQSIHVLLQSHTSLSLCTGIHIIMNIRMNIHSLMHERFEAPGAIETWANDHHHPITYTRFYQHDILPETVDG